MISAIQDKVIIVLFYIVTSNKKFFWKNINSLKFKTINDEFYDILFRLSPLLDTRNKVL